MIGLGLRLALAGGREAILRLVVLAAAVALGVGLLLATVSGINATNTQNVRYAWLNSVATSAATGPQAPDPAWWASREDFYRGHPMDRIEVAALGAHPPVPPGMTALPAAGEYYVSPALDRLLRTVPADELRDRYPGREAGILGRAALPSPDSLLVVVGGTPQQVSRLPNAVRITRIVTVSPSDCRGCVVGVDGNGIALVLSVVAAALIFPVLVFIGTATRMSAARREQRFAAMRLVGATPRQITLFAAIESAAAAAAGTLAGFVLFLALRVAIAQVPFTGDRFYPSDLTLSAVQVIAVAAGVPLAAAIAARLALRRVRISPLGVTRRVTPRPPRAWRLIPLLAGLGELSWLLGHHPRTTNGQLIAYLSGIFTILIGLMIAGPYLTMIGSRVLARLARRPATLIAGRRLADDPRAGFRAVSGLMLALFVTSTATGLITTVVAERGNGTAGSAVRDFLAAGDTPDDGQPADPAKLPPSLATAPGVRRVQGIRLNNADYQHTDALPGLITCTDLAQMPGGGTCPPGAQIVSVFTNLIGYNGMPATAAGPIWPAAPISLADMQKQPTIAVVVDTDGSPAAIEHVRTVLDQTFPGGWPAASEADHNLDFTRLLFELQRLADVVIVASLVIAGCSLVVSIVGGLSERRRPFSMLRLTGVRLGELRRVVALESLVPLAAVSVVAVAVGFLAAHLFLRSQLQYSLHAPGLAYYVIVGLGLLVSVGLVASTMPLLKRLTGPETARNE